MARQISKSSSGEATPALPDLRLGLEHRRMSRVEPDGVLFIRSADMTFKLRASRLKGDAGSFLAFNLEPRTLNGC